MFKLTCASCDCYSLSHLHRTTPILCHYQMYLRRYVAFTVLAFRTKTKTNKHNKQTNKKQQLIDPFNKERFTYSTTLQKHVYRKLRKDISRR